MPGYSLQRRWQGNMSLQRALCATRHEPTKAGYTQELATKLRKGFAEQGIFKTGHDKGAGVKQMQEPTLSYVWTTGSKICPTGMSSKASSTTCHLLDWVHGLCSMEPSISTCVHLEQVPRRLNRLFCKGCLLAACLLKCSNGP